MKSTTEQPTARKRNRYTADDRERARKYYLMGLNLHEISTLLGNCPTRTLEAWQKADGWTKLKELSNIEVRAYELNQGGKTYKEIAALLEISEVTVWRYVKKVKTAKEAAPNR